MSAGLNIRVSKEDKELITREAAKRNLSQKDFVIDAVKHFINPEGQGEAFGPGLREIVTKYKGQCSKCGDPIPVGTKAWYGRRQKGTRSILVCLNCMVLGMSDKSLAKRYIKIKEFEAILRGLKKEADQLARSLFDSSIFQKNEEFQRAVREAVDRYERYLKASTPAEERELLETFLDVLKEAERVAGGIDDFLYLQMRRLGKVKKKAAVVSK